ncbi:hypothetical protein NM688_g7772 [Phlebia brevispora]|uniref:Uncharacterized protein n=1 Tax=Phlebia brevispora TaxID=194682 RepID=A0ACC1S1D4_9APHY|nr:hypothetical protein NM688_g7772 [Phlebia brevispora]
MVQKHLEGKPALPPLFTAFGSTTGLYKRFAAHLGLSDVSPHYAFAAWLSRRWIGGNDLSGNANALIRVYFHEHASSLAYLASELASCHIPRFTPLKPSTARAQSQSALVLPILPEPTTPPQKTYEKDEDTELAILPGLTSISNARSSGVGSPDLPPHSEGKIPWWRPHLQFAACCSSLFLAGWNDGSTGPLLPRIQSNYHVDYAVVSLIFIFNCVGFITAAIANVHLTDRFGFGRVMVIGAVAQTIGYALEAPAPPFPVFVLGYAVNGFGLALQDAGANGYVASLREHAAIKMGVLHAVYGLGALCAPLSATQFYHRTRWSFQYLISVCLALAVTVVLITDVCRLGWTVTYIINVRGGGSSSGYVSSGFFGGLTFGRIALLWLNKLVGERRAVFLYTILAIGLELVVWLVPSLVGGAVAVSFIGMLLGPIYPIVMNHSARILPRSLLTGSIGWIAGFGQAGSAFIPFLTGAIASSKGIQTLQPL